ncbi:hypothetical protein LAZ40_07220 [Cereibacter sphaeroides]|uniref:hypothetical protein n=1 Tax=Cereibacter sphaeroides TaxID=1063 RepID=UPI001F35595B|nr:hypothetical protein [Cereibacter sphaeroides]MCE6958838.1 hypothetical protein [Cereibacter sphaeroides]MCE6973288.1 hypothetical protein [Cereibacter sphaeroides]
MSKILASLVLLLVVGLVAGPSRADPYCNEPDAPFCVEQYGAFDDEGEFDRCRDEVEDYVSDVEDYRNCLVEAHDEAGEEASEVVERFNCKAEGNDFCP